jgi:predicted site-specific integrase-resolvase
MTEIFFWDHVRALMKKNKITQAELARVCGISFNTLHGWMVKGIYPPVIDAYNIFIPPTQHISA